MFKNIILIFVAMISFGFNSMVSAQGSAKPTICIYHPDTLMLRDPQTRSVLIQVRMYEDILALTDAIPYIRRSWRSTNSERRDNAMVAAIQYSMFNRYQDANNTLIGNYFYLGNVSYPTDVSNASSPALAIDTSLYNAVQNYLNSSDESSRVYWARWLTAVVNSPTNRDCNPWRNY